MSSVSDQDNRLFEEEYKGDNVSELDQRLGNLMHHIQQQEEKAKVSPWYLTGSCLVGTVAEESVDSMSINNRNSRTKVVKRDVNEAHNFLRENGVEIVSPSKD